jgi:hypothetical protein
VASSAARPRRRPEARAALCAAIVLLMITLGLAACATSKPAADVHPSDPPASTQDPTPTSAASHGSSQPSSRPASSTRVSAPARARTSKPAPATTVGGDVITVAGVILPNRARTPGAINAAVTQGSISHTICVSGWTQTIRPSSSYTTSLKEQQLASGYAYHGDANRSDYEEDHLISLELGGSADSPLNLWPEPYAAIGGARVKDKIENKLDALVCSGSISLATAQRAIAGNWYTAYQTYIGTPATTTPTTHPATSQPPAAQAQVEPGNGATALCNDGTYSYAAHHQGACSRHGGVKVFYK